MTFRHRHHLNHPQATARTVRRRRLVVRRQALLRRWRSTTNRTRRPRQAWTCPRLPKLQSRMPKKVQPSKQSPTQALCSRRYRFEVVAHRPIKPFQIAAIASTDKKEAAGKSGLSFDFFRHVVMKQPQQPIGLVCQRRPLPRPRRNRRADVSNYPTIQREILDPTWLTLVSCPVEKTQFSYISAEQLLPDTSSRGSRDAESSFSSPPARTDVSFSSPIQSPSSSSSLSVAHALPKSIPLERESEEISSAEDALTEDIDLRDILNPKLAVIPSEAVIAPPIVTASSPVLSGIASASTFLMPDLSKPPPTIPHLSAAPRHGPTTGIVAPFLRPVDPRQAPPAMPPRMHGYDPRGFSTFPPRGPPPNTSNFPRDPRSIRRSPQDAAQVLQIQFSNAFSNCSISAFVPAEQRDIEWFRCNSACGGRPRARPTDPLHRVSRRLVVLVKAAIHKSSSENPRS